MAAGLFLVLAFGVGFAANGFAGREPWAASALVPRDSACGALATTTSMCCWPEPESRNSFVCGSREKRSAKSSSSMRWMAWPMRSSSARVFGSMAKVMEGSGMRTGGIENWRGLVAQSVAGQRVFQFGNGAQIARVHFRHVGARFCPASPGRAAGARKSRDCNSREWRRPSARRTSL